VVASVVLIITVIVLGYLRFVRGIDIFKPARNWLAVAYCTIVGNENYTIIDKNELHDLMAAAEKPTVVTQETYVVQADGSVTKDSGAYESKDTPEDETNADSEESPSDATDQEAGEAVSSLSQPDKNTKNDVEQKSNLVQNISEPTESSRSINKTPSEDQGVAALMKRAQKADPAAYLELADYYYNSIDGRTHAFEWYQRAAECGIPRALLRCGDCLMAGLGTEKNELKAVEAYKKAAGKNDTEAQYRMGECCLNGTGCAVNKSEAFSWFFKAAIAGYKPAVSTVAECYEKGIGVEKNLQNAKQWRARLSKKKIGL
jgi:TPR repeat protein